MGKMSEVALGQGKNPGFLREVCETGLISLYGKRNYEGRHIRTNDLIKGIKTMTAASSILISRAYPNK
jgi:hypothetical protein